MVVFEIERSALALACEKIDQWIARANGEAPSSRAQSRTESPVPRARTILVVDDQPDIGPMARDILEPAGYVVLLTSDPLEAIRLARHRPGDIDLLLVDRVGRVIASRKLGGNMRQLREAKGLTQEQLAERAQVTLRVISIIEEGQSGNPSVGKVTDTLGG